MIFGDLGPPQGEPKIIKNRKIAFQKSIEKKDEKKKARQPVLGEGRRQSRSPGNPKIPFRKAFAKSGNQFKTRQHSRRSAADSLRSRDSRRPLRLEVSKILFDITDQQ